MSKIQYLALNLILILLFSAPFETFAADQTGTMEDSRTRMDDVVVTATRFPTATDRVAGRIDVITAKDIEQLPFERVDDLLGYVAGAYTDRTDNIFEMSPRVTLRGLGGNVPGRTLVLIDGQPASIGDSGNMRWNRINTADIQRIEVSKGPGSSVYGSNAMGGVINIITRQPESKAEGSVAVGYGTYNTRKGSARIAGRQGPDKGFYGQVAATGMKSDGYTSLAPTSKNYDGRVDKFMDELNVDAKAGYKFNKDSCLELSHSYFDDSRGEGYKYTLEDGTYRDFDNNNTRMIFKSRLGAFDLKAGGFYQKEEYYWHRDFKDVDSIYQVFSDREDFGGNLTLSTTIANAHTVTLGTDTRYSSVDAIDDYDTSDDFALNRGKLDQYAAFIQDDYSLLNDRLTITAGLRFDQVRFHEGTYQSNTASFSALSGDMNSNTWNAISPKLATRYRINDDFSAYASYSRGFRAPILDSLCRYGIMYGRFYDANPDLENETIDTYEIGVDASLLSNRLTVSLSSYYSRGKDFIYSVDTGETRFLWGRNRAVYLKENASEVTITGIEAEADFEILPSVKLFTGYAFNDSVIDSFEKRPDLEDKKLEYVPRHTAHAGLQWMNPVVNTSLTLRFVGERFSDDQNTEELPSYNTLDLKLWRELDFIAKGLKATLTVHNLADKEYQVSDDETGPGRFIIADLSYQW